ncbi:MAG: hypothetical protein DRO11_00410 [Methanobacteriota archaeon]|nr:MAG: hypothetical protein DRO11_00410 [Euryarchaeota archaeon]
MATRLARPRPGLVFTTLTLAGLEPRTIKKNRISNSFNNTETTSPQVVCHPRLFARSEELVGTS